MSKLIQLRQVFVDLILTLRRAYDNLPVSENITLKGPTTVNQGEAATWEITDHDAFSRYDVEVNLGTASVSDNIITHIHEFGEPTESPFKMSVSCNGSRRDLFVNINPRGILKPYLSSITSALSGSGYTLTLTSHQFRVMPNGGDTHVSTDWEIASDSAFTNVVWSSLNNTTNKLTITTAVLPAGSTVYVRLRHRGSTFPVSKWFVTKLTLNGQLTTSWTTSFNTVYSAGPTTTVSSNTSWLTEKTTMEYSAGSKATDYITSYRTFVNDEWVDIARTTKHLTDHVTSLPRSTSWMTAVSTSSLTAVGYSTPVSKTTQFDTSSVFSTSRNTYLASVDASGNVVEETRSTSWSTMQSLLTSKTTSYNSVYAHDTSAVTTYPTQHVTSATTSWNTSYGTSHVTSYDTGGSHVTSITTSWTSVASWVTTFNTSATTTFITSWDATPINDLYNGPPVYTSGNTSRITSWTASRTTSVYTQMSHVTSWNTSDVVVTSHTTSYSTTYGTSQPTSWTTTYDSSHTTTWATNVRYTSKSTSNNTSKLTG